MKIFSSILFLRDDYNENKNSFTPNVNMYSWKILEINSRKFFFEIYSYSNYKKYSHHQLSLTNTVVLKNKRIILSHFYCQCNVLLKNKEQLYNSFSLFFSFKSFILKLYPYSTARKIYTHSRKSRLEDEIIKSEPYT